MEKVKKVWRRIRGLVAASGQLRVGLVLFALVLLVVLFAPQLAPFDPYDLGWCRRERPDICWEPPTWVRIF